METKNKSNNALCLTYEKPAGNAPAGWKSQIPLSLMTAGNSVILSGIFTGVSLPVMLIAGIALNILLMYLYRSRFGNLVFPAGCVLAAVLCAVFYKAVSAGMGAAANDVLSALSKTNGRIYMQFDGGNVYAGLMPFAVFTALLMGYAASKGAAAAALPVLLAGMGASLLGTADAGPGWWLIFIGTLFIPWGADISDSRQALMKTGVIAAAAVLSLGLGVAVRSVDTEDLQLDLKHAVHAAVWDEKSNSMPEGQLADLGPWKKNDTTALTVTAEEPQKLYLRGKIYETYTGDRWLPADNSKKAEAADLFYWLHHSGFYGQGQISSTPVSPEEYKTIKIENKTACRATSYLPYGIADDISFDPMMSGDDISVPDEGKEHRMISGGLPQWYAIQVELSERQNEPEIKEYLAMAQSYEDYVKENDLQLTPESWAVLQRQLGKNENPLSLGEIQKNIRSHLEKYVSYDETVSTPSGDEDFLKYVLERSGSGYSVHYATAAVLMLRYYGVPARYVEGYFLSAENAEKVKKGESVDLTEENAHAWAEYYLTGVGFVPFEVTPGYIDSEELGLDGDAQKGGALYSSDSQKYEMQLKPDKPAVDDEKPAAELSLMWLIALPLMLLAALAIFVIIRRSRLRKALKKIDDSDNRDAVAMLYGYASMLMGTLGEIDIPRADEAAFLNREAMFSNHEISDENLAQMKSFSDDVQSLCKKKWGLWLTIRRRFIDGIIL